MATPVANAGPDLKVEPYAAVRITGSATDPDGSVVSYTWRQVSGTAVQSFATAQELQFMAPVTRDGTSLVFGLRATDNAGGVGVEDTVTITVLPHNEWATTSTGTQVPFRIRTGVVGGGGGAGGSGYAAVYPGTY